MESLFLLLSRERRRQRQELGHFLDAVSLYLEAGFDLGYAWPEVHRVLAGQLSPQVRDTLAVARGGAISPVLARLGETYPDRQHRLWFQVLRELYERGAGLRDGVEAAARALREEQERDLEAHCLRLPTRANVVLLLFFLPPTLLLLFAPLIGEIGRAF